MDSGQALVWIAAIIAAALVVQAVAILVFLLSVKKSVARMEATVTAFLADVRPVLQSAGEFLSESREKLGAVTAKIESVTVNIVEITGIVKSQARRLDGMITDASDQARLQLIRLDQLMQGALSRVEETGDVVRRSIATPIREMSALVFGLRTSLNFLLNRGKARRSPVPQDEELFI